MDESGSHLGIEDHPVIALDRIIVFVLADILSFVVIAVCVVAASNILA